MDNKRPLLILLCMFSSIISSSLAYSIKDYAGIGSQGQQGHLQQCQMRCVSQGQDPRQCQQRCLQQISSGGAGGRSQFGLVVTTDADSSPQSEQKLQEAVQQCHQMCQSQTQRPIEQMQCTRSCVEQQMKQGGRGRTIPSFAPDVDYFRQGQQEQEVSRQCQQLCQGQGESRMQCESQCVKVMGGRGGHGPVSPFSLGDPKCRTQCSQYQPLTAEWFVCQSRCQQRQQYGTGGSQGSFYELETGSHGASGQPLEHCQQVCQSTCGRQVPGPQQFQCHSHCLQSCMEGGQQQRSGGRQCVSSSRWMLGFFLEQ